jgi:hypothetical protein
MAESAKPANNHTTMHAIRSLRSASKFTSLWLAMRNGGECEACQ